MSVVMRVQPIEHGALQALNSVLQSVESVRSARATYPLRLAFTGVVFARGRVAPGVVYLRGLCEPYLALRRRDGDEPAPTPLP
jgi:hypothetical protein